MIYLDNAATSFPKPREVFEEMVEIYGRIGVLPGGGGYELAVRCERYVEEVRRRVSDFFGAGDPQRVFFAYNSTNALKAIIEGLAAPGSHVVSTRLEHNAVLRPLHRLREQGVITFDLVGFDQEGFLDPREVADLIGPSTKCVIVNHVSNVLGTIQPVAEVGRICRDRGTALVLDVSQSAGLVPIDMEAMNVEAVAFTGHKFLLGPMGVGGLVLGRGIEARALRSGGWGEDSLNSRHPVGYGYCVEPGSPNIAGIIGLSAGMRYIERRGMSNLQDRVMSLTRALRDGLASIRGVKMYCAENLDNHTGVIACNIEGVAPGDFAAALDRDFGIAARSGGNCAPLVHEDIGAGPPGAVRFSPGPFNTAEDIAAVVAATATLARR